jgi:radical SAM superfamily enzyme YgiQ (UPF0313 family)
VAELREARQRWGIRRFDVIDDCFNADPRRVVEFCDAVRELGLPWTCANGLRADRFDAPMAAALRRSGCQYLSFGVESVDDAVLQTIRKGETASQITRAVQIAQRHFPGRVNCFLILGLPGSSYASDRDSLRWALRQGVSANVSFFVDHEQDVSGDAVFSGDRARPTSDAYDRTLQQALYNLTSYMRRHRTGRFRLLWNALHTLRLILTLDPWRLPLHVWCQARRVLKQCGG